MCTTRNEAQLISALGFGQICAWGTLYYSYPLIVEAMMPELGWSREQLYGPATVGLLLAALLTYPVGLAVDRGHGRAVLMGSSLLAATLFVFWSSISSIYTFYAFATLLGALQAATLYEPAFAVLARSVGSTRARRGVTHITLWGGLSSTVFIPIVQYLIQHWGWREALWFLATINMLLAVIYRWQIPVALKEEDPNTLRGEAALRDHNAIKESLRTRVFWLLLLAMTAYAAAFSSFTFHMYPMLLEGGLQVRDVVFALALIGPAQVAGRVVIGLLGERASMRRVGCWTVAILPPVFPALLFLGDHLNAVALLCCVYGAANGIFTIVRSLVIPEMVTPNAYGALNGMINLPATLARAVAPWATAVAWGVTQSYGPVLWAITATFLVMAMAFWAAAWSSVRRVRLDGSIGRSTL